MKAGRQPMAGRVPTRVPAVGREAAPVRMSAFPRISAVAVSSARTPASAFVTALARGLLFVSADNRSASWTSDDHPETIR
jgi:hypothetical protein